MDLENQTFLEENLTLEKLGDMQTLEIEVRSDLSQVLTALNDYLRTFMEPRGNGFHLTIISPTERKVLDALTPEQLNKLQTISDQLQKGEGIQISGVGFIDGVKAPNLRAVDKEKKTSFIAIESPLIQEFRAKLGLPRKDLHITLGFEGGDIHMEIIGKNGKGKDVLAPIAKKADPNLAQFTPDNLSFGAISGQKS